MLLFFMNKEEQKNEKEYILLGLDSKDAKEIAILLAHKSINECLCELNRICRPYRISVGKYSLNGEKRLYFSKKGIMVSNALFEFYIKYRNSNKAIENYHINKNWTALSSLITVDDSQFCQILL